MIECPICHVMNEDQSFFCSECGQRFSPAQANTGFPQQPTPWQGSAPPAPSPSPAPTQMAPGYAPADMSGGYQSGAQPFAPEQPPTQNAFPTSGGPLFQPQASNAVEPQEHPAEVKKRPKLHSPILGGSDDDDFDQGFEPEPPMPTGKKGGLRSPLLRGDDVDDQPSMPHKPRAGRGRTRPTDDFEPNDDSAGQRKSGGLRSPLLGGADDEDSDDMPQQRPGAKRGPLRSPLLRGDDADDFDKPSKGGGRERTGFPHRRRAEDFDEEDDAPSSGRPLRSPLLGSDGQPLARRSTDVPGGKSTGGHRRLHSPVLDGTGEFYYDDFEDQESEPYDENDPNMLRSPLLAARQKVQVEKPAPAPQVSASVDLPPALTTPPPPVAEPASHSQPTPQVQPYVAPVVVPPPAPKPAPSRMDEAEPQSRVPLSIYDSGLRQTIPGEAPIKSGPAMVIVIPAVIALICKGFYFIDLMKVPNIAQQTWFLADQLGQTLVVLGLLIFGLSAKRR